MNHIYIIKRLESGRLLVAVNYGSISVITQRQYDEFVKRNAK
jgi:hypothetical protein